MRFAFGKNWKPFSEHALTQERISQARRDFKTLFEGIDLRRRRFVDIGFGQGLTLFLAKECGAQVIGIDIDLDRRDASVAAHRFFHQFAPLLKEMYLDRERCLFSDFSQHIIRRIATEHSGIMTQLTNARRHGCRQKRCAWLLEILDQEGGVGRYISGSKAMAYIDARVFQARNIKLNWMDYSGYLEYRQLHPPFVHEVGIIDLMLNEGPDARRYM